MPPALQNPYVQWLLLSVALAVFAHFQVRKELRLRLTLYGSLLLACAISVYPPAERIQLGLDLRGGIHLVLQVVTDDALEATVDDAVQTVRNEASQKGIQVASVSRRDTSSFAVEGVEPARAKDMHEILEDFFREWDVREQQEGQFLVSMTDPKLHRVRQQTVEEAIRTLERRVNELGVAEPVISEHGSTGDQILVQLPGVQDVEQAKRVIKRTAQLSLNLVENSAPTREALLQPHGGEVPPGLELVEGRGEQPGERVYYLVQREAVITGRDLKNARAGIDPQTNSPNVHFSLLPVGSEKFGRETGRSVGRQLAIVLDGVVESAPVIQSRITSDGQISGRFSVEEADELAKVLRAGALPATLKYLQQLTVGASLGRDSIRSGVVASLAAVAFIAIFVLVYYRLAGVNAIVALSANLLILMGAMAYFGATLTLPGIAGVILTVGIGVDTNVLVFERIREELRAGKSVKMAVTNGFDRVWVTIMDTHATGLIAAAFLFQFGTGPIKGFAVTLFIGLMANVVASFFISKFLFEWILGKRPVQSLSI